MTSSPIPMRFLGREDSARFCRLAGLLARPALDAGHARLVRRMVTRANWRPLPRLASMLAVEALFVHHLRGLGLREADVFDPGSSSAPLPDFRVLAANHALRRRALVGVIRELGASGVERVLLVKGAAVGALWPSPALREMEDLDLVVEEHQVERVHAVLGRLGWTPRRTSWVDPSGVALDLQVARSPFARRLMVGAVPHPHLSAHGPALMPRPADHLVLIALHGARHRGLRLWRDLADMQTLLRSAEGPRIATEAVAVARRFDGAVPLLACHRLLNRWGVMRDQLPGECGDPRRDSQAAALSRVYQALLVDPLGEFGAYAVDSLLPSPGRLAGLVLGMLRGGDGPGGAPSAQRDPQWGEAVGGRFSRQRTKARVLLRVVSARRLGHYRRLAGAFRRLQTPRVFDSL